MNLIARKLAHLLAENANDSYYEDEIRYGLEIVLGGLLQMTIIMVVALLLGMGKEVFAVIISAALFRRYSGGAHCQAYYRCTIVSLVNSIFLAYLSRFIPANYMPFYITGLAMLAILVIHYYVPVDNPIYPITDKLIKRKRKLRSYWVLLLVLLVSIIAAYIMEEKLVAISVLLGLCWQNITLLPGGHLFIHVWDQFFEKVEEKFKRKEVMKC